MNQTRRQFLSSVAAFAFAPLVPLVAKAPVEDLPSVGVQIMSGVMSGDVLTWNSQNGFWESVSNLQALQYIGK